MKAIIPVNPEFVFCEVLSEPVVIELGTPPDGPSLKVARDNITDQQCGDYRQCFTKSSDIPGCGIRIQTDNLMVSAECPAGTTEPYIKCAENVLNFIVKT